MEVLLVVVLALLDAALAAAPGPSTPVALLYGCGAADRWCLAFPDGCSADNTCTTVLTVRRDPAEGSDKYLFEMSGAYSGFVAVALAETTLMGNDSVVECIHDLEKKEVLLYQSVNYVNPDTAHKDNRRLPVEEQRGVTLVARPLDKGVDLVSCSFLRDRVTTVNGKQYDLATGSWVLQAASGIHLADDTSIRRHMEYVVSADKVKISEPSGLIRRTYSHRRAAAPSHAPSHAPQRELAALATVLMAFVTHCVT